MTERPANPALGWIYKRDGRLVPFDADKISRSLFAATEALGRPDAFLARELTDGILHFLKAEVDGTVPTTAHLRDLVAKVVRELGQVELAQAFVRFAELRIADTSRPAPVSSPPHAEALGPSFLEMTRLIETNADPAEILRRAGQACLRQLALREVFTRDLAAAHAAGLLVLGELEHPLELASSVLGPPRGDAVGLFELIGRSRSWTGQWLALDAAELQATLYFGTGDEAPARMLQKLESGLREVGLRAVLNLNESSVPAWASELADGPLFQSRTPLPTTPIPVMAPRLLEHWSANIAESSRIHVVWHLAQSDFAPESTKRLESVARFAGAGQPLTFVFDRPRRPVTLAEGLDRDHPAVLMTVGLGLAVLADQAGADPAALMRKVGSLARLALSAATQKREFLRRRSRRHSLPAQAFLIDRARLVVAPLGIDGLARRFFGTTAAEPGPGQEWACELIEHLRTVLLEDGQAKRLDTHLELTIAPGAATDSADSSSIDRTEAPGVPVTAHVTSAHRLLEAAHGGTVNVVRRSATPLPADEVIAVLRQAWRCPSLIRLRFLAVSEPARQLVAPWEE